MAKPGQGRATSTLVWVSGLILVVALVFAVRYFTRELVEVRVVTATYRPILKTVSTNGKVEPVEEFPAYAPFPGVVKQIYVEVGQHVTKGQLLLRMDDADARARVATARANVSNAQNILADQAKGGNLEDRTRFTADISNAQLAQQDATRRLTTQKALFARGSASAAEVAGAQQQLDGANLTLQTAKQHGESRFSSADRDNASLHVADAQAAMASAENNLNNIDIRSPITGTVYNIPVNQYDFVGVPSNQDILDVADLNHLQVRAYFDEPEIGGLKHGQPVTILWDAKRGTVWHGHVDLVPTSIFIYGNRNVGICLITVDDPTPDLIPNTNVTVTVTEMKRDNVLSIPREALHVDNGQSFVYKIVKGKLVQATVVPGIVNLTYVEITSGLEVNDTVVLGPKNSVTDLADGLAVKQVQ